MSEKHVYTAEKQHETLSEDNAELQVNNKPDLNEAFTERARKELLSSARQEVESQTDTKEQIKSKIDQETSPQQETFQPPVNNKLKQITLQRELKRVRERLSAPDKLASRVIHQPVIRVISEASSKTISRPSGMLGGSLVAFIGTGLYYLFTKHVGIEYNYFVFIVLFVAGFVVGICLELIVWALRSHKKAQT